MNPAINPKVLNDLRALEEQGSPGFLAELIDVFLREFARHLNGLRQAIEDRDARVAERLAHTMKGSSGNLGAEPLSRLCSTLQDVAHASDWDTLRSLIPQVEAEYVRAGRELQAERQRKA